MFARRVVGHPAGTRALVRTFARNRKHDRFTNFYLRTTNPMAVFIACCGVLTTTSVLCESRKMTDSADKKVEEASKKGKPSPYNVSQVRKDLESMLDDDITKGPALVRLAWHAAGNWDSKGKDGMPNMASMRFKPECKFAANAGLEAARDWLEPIKKKHPNVTYADLWVLAGCVAVEAMGGPRINFRWGRTDATEAKSPDGRLPDAAKSYEHVREVFTRLGFNDRETVALLGAHAVGECHANASGFVGPWTHDKYGFTNSLFTTLNDNEWLIDKSKPKLQYTDLKTRSLMMLPTDVCLLYDKEYKNWVDKYATDEDLFKRDFAKAFQKLMELGCEDKLNDS
jgi:catalase (peroxidase I)